MHFIYLVLEKCCTAKLYLSSFGFRRRSYKDHIVGEVSV
jgi:hypothetical protein